jgi:hypothetical protein
MAGAGELLIHIDETSVNRIRAILFLNAVLSNPVEK